MTEPGSTALRPWEPVLIVGTGLIGTSVGLALARAGVTAQLADSNRSAAQVAAVRGAGIGQEGTRPGLVLVATPPDHLADEIVAALVAYPDAVVTDVGSIKAGPLAGVRDRVTVAQAARYVGGHPMAGSERSGPTRGGSRHLRRAVLGGHAGRGCRSASGRSRRDVGPGLWCLRRPDGPGRARPGGGPDVAPAAPDGRVDRGPAPGHPGDAPSARWARDSRRHRIAASDPGLWRQIVLANAVPLRELLRQLRDQFDELVDALGDARAGPLDVLLASGVAGTALIPGKHNAPAEELATVTVHVPDRPGELAALFAAAGKASVNIEDLRIDHDPGRDYGLVEIDVNDDRVDDLIEALAGGGWSAHR